MKINVSIWDTVEEIDRARMSSVMGVPTDKTKMVFKKGSNYFKIPDVKLHIDRNWIDADKNVQKFNDKVTKEGKRLEELIIVEGYFDELTRITLRTQFEETKEKIDMSVFNVANGMINKKKNNNQEFVSEITEKVVGFLEKWVNNEIKKNCRRYINIDFVMKDDSGREVIVDKKEYETVLMIAYSEDSKKEFKKTEENNKNDNEKKIFSKITFKNIKNNR